jgi:hypothetical protein
MNTVVGVFESRSEAERACTRLAPLDIPERRVNVLTPQMTECELAEIPAVEAEQPGMGKALGAAVGGAVGLAGGMSVAEVALSSLVLRQLEQSPAVRLKTTRHQVGQATSCYQTNRGNLPCRL